MHDTTVEKRTGCELMPLTSIWY